MPKLENNFKQNEKSNADNGDIDDNDGNDDNVNDNNDDNNDDIIESEQEEQIETKGGDKGAELETIIKGGAITAVGQGLRLHCMSIIGQVEGHYLLGSGQKATKYEHLIPLLVSVELDDTVDGLLIMLNTIGGDVEAGLAIAEMIASMTKPTVSLVLGGGHSIGVPLAVSAKRSFIVSTATMTLHPVRISGTVIGAPQTFYYFNRMQDRILSFIGSHSKADVNKIKELVMKTDEIATDIGSVISGPEAVELGLIDTVGGLADAIAALREMKEKKEKREKKERKAEEDKK